MSNATNTTILESALQNGWVEIESGVYVNSLENILAEQAGWDDSDESKNIDFSRAPFWLTTDSGEAPQPIHSEKDLPGTDAAFEKLVSGGGVVVDRKFNA